MLFKERCYNGGKKHNFQPRYSKQSYVPNNIDTVATIAFMEAIKTNISKYEGDVCEWCGMAVNERK